MIDGYVLGLLAVFLALLGYVPYIIAFAKGDIKPHFFSWLLWGLNSFIIYFSQESHGAGPGAWTSLMEGVICTSVAIFAIKWGEREIEQIDVASFGLAMVGIACSFVVESVYPAILLSSLIDFLAFYPTIRKSWNKPKEEGLTLYTTSNLSMITSLMALDHINFASSFNIFSFLLLQSFFIGMVVWRRYVVHDEPMFLFFKPQKRIAFVPRVKREFHLPAALAFARAA